MAELGRRDGYTSMVILRENGYAVRPVVSAGHRGKSIMELPLGIPENAWCRKCGYALRGLPGLVCPECGRCFDPADTRTFHSKPPGWRTKRWARRAAAAAGIALILLIVCPRGLMRSSVAFTCADCGRVHRQHQVELRPPWWMPMRYPSLRWSETLAGRGPHLTEFHMNYRCDIISDLHCRGRVTGSADCSTGSPCEVNGILVTPESAQSLLREMLAPTNFGIAISDGR